MIKIVIFIVNLLKGIVILFLPLTFDIMGDGPHTDEFYLTLYILKCVFSLIAVWVISDALVMLLDSYNNEPD